MGVSRNITVVVYSNIENSFVLIEKFLVGFWINSSSTFVHTFFEDNTDNQIMPTEIKFNELRTLFYDRALLNKENTISFYVSDLDEKLILSVKNLENSFNDDKVYEIWINPGGMHKLIDYERNTDFSYYLNLILPRFKAIGCYPFEIKCFDIG
jgi:hypothetical protein